MKLIKKMILAVTGISMIFTLNLSVSAEEEGVRAFDDFLMEEYVEAMESDYTTMHFGVRDYRKYGIEKPDPIIGTAKWEDYENGVKDAEETLAKLESFDYEKLSESQKHDYDTYHFYLECLKELNSYPYFDWYFTPSEGLIDNLPTNFTEFVFYEKQDIDDYLSVLASVYDYIMDALEITRIQAEAGYFMTDGALDETLDAIDKFVKRTDDNPLLVDFEENVDEFEGLSEEEKNDYKERNRYILFNSYIPAYQKAAEELEKYRGTRSDDEPIALLKDGKEYYAAKVRFKASTEKSVAELTDLVADYVELEIQNYIDLIYSVTGEAALNGKISLTDPMEILKYHQEHMKNYPDGPEVTYRADYLDPAVASDGIVAYYLEPPVDQIYDNVIKINGDNVADTNELYSTLAHEGFPGHLYQITWYLNTNPNLLRTTLSNIGYSEGWAMYAEDDSWEYSTLKEKVAEYNRVSTSMGYALNAYADIGVNGLGWSREELGRHMSSVGLNDAVAGELYDFVMDTPGVIIPYGAGLAQFMELRDSAYMKLGSQFDIKEFNTVLLTYGDRPFEIVEKDVQAWIDTFDISKSEYPPVPSHYGKKEVSPWIYALGAGAAIILAAAGILLIRKSRKSDPFA